MFIYTFICHTQGTGRELFRITKTQALFSRHEDKDIDKNLPTCAFEEILLYDAILNLFRKALCIDLFSAKQQILREPRTDTSSTLDVLIIAVWWLQTVD